MMQPIVPADQLEAARASKNPLPYSQEIIDKGKIIYEGKGTCFTRLRRKPRLSSRGGMRDGCPPKPWRRRAASAGSAEALVGATAVKPWGSTCHGMTGRGEGPGGANMKPAARNFLHRGMWRHRTEGEIFWVIKNGSPGTGMIAFRGLLSDEEVWTLMHYERSFAGGGHGPGKNRGDGMGRGGPRGPMDGGGPRGGMGGMREGEKGCCQHCHGPKGRGDGQMAQYLTPPPADLTSTVTQSKTDDELRKVIIA